MGHHSTPPSDHAAAEVRQHYHLSGELIALGNCGGFSGAHLWQMPSLGDAFCLRAWPEHSDPSRLRDIHRLMQQAHGAGLRFVPAVRKTRAGDTVVVHAGRLWDLTTWMPGRADFHARPTEARARSACTALAQSHAVWASLASGSAPCPGIQRRREQVARWRELTDSGWQPRLEKCADPALRFWAGRAWDLVRSRMNDVSDKLEPWSGLPFPVQPCLCDPWHDHVLFEDDDVTGLIDYGSVKMDHVAVDLARLLGDLVGDDASLRAAGLEAYQQLRPLSATERHLLEVLDFTGTVLSAENWLRWLFVEERSYEEMPAVCRRLASLVERMEKWQFKPQGDEGVLGV